MERYFIANPDAKELIAFPDGKAFLVNTTSSYDAANYAKATGQTSTIVKREDFKNEIEAALKKINGESAKTEVSEENNEVKTKKKK